MSIGRAVKALSFLLTPCLSPERCSRSPLFAVKFTKVKHDADWEVLMNQKSLVWTGEGFSGHAVLCMLLYKLHTSSLVQIIHSPPPPYS